MDKPEKYGHGGDTLTAGALFGVDPGQLNDFSANINPLGPPESVIRLLREEPLLVTRYPDPAQREFRSAVASRIGVDPEMILAGNGAAECMALAILAFAPKMVGVVYPCFSEYTQLAVQFGASVEAVYAEESSDFLPLREDLLDLAEKCDLIFIGHPNNPTGTLFPLELLEAAAEACELGGCYLLVDEAFLDFLPEQEQVSLIDRLDVYGKVVLIRSMTKFYAIPGLRLGYAVSRTENIARMKGKQVSWSVNRLALHSGTACLREAAYERQTREYIRKEREYMLSRLSGFAGWQVWPSQANYLLLRAPVGLNAATVQRKLGENGFLVRDCSMYPGLSDRDIRLAVKSREDNERLLQKMTELGFDSFVEKGEDRA